MRVKWIIGGLIVAVGIFIGGFVWHNNIKRGWVDGSSVSLRYAMELEYRLEDHVNKVKFIPGSVAWTTDSYVALDSICAVITEFPNDFRYTVKVHSKQNHRTVIDEKAHAQSLAQRIMVYMQDKGVVGEINPVGLEDVAIRCVEEDNPNCFDLNNRLEISVEVLPER